MDLINSVDNVQSMATASTNRLDTLLNRMGNGVQDTHMLNNLGGFMAHTLDLGGGGDRRERAWVIAGNLLDSLSRQYGNRTNNNNTNNNTNNK